jgi:hypothetical protein
MGNGEKYESPPNKRYETNSPQQSFSIKNLLQPSNISIDSKTPRSPEIIKGMFEEENALNYQRKIEF